MKQIMHNTYIYMVRSFLWVVIHSMQPVTYVPRLFVRSIGAPEVKKYPCRALPDERGERLHVEGAAGGRRGGVELPEGEGMARGVEAAAQGLALGAEAGVGERDEPCARLGDAELLGELPVPGAERGGWTPCGGASSAPCRRPRRPRRCPPSPTTCPPPATTWSSWEALPAATDRLLGSSTARRPPPATTWPWVLPSATALQEPSPPPPATT